MKKTRSVDDYVLGGRGIGPWMSALSFGTAYFSAVLFIGFAGKIGWGFGLSGLWIAVGNAVIGSLGAWLVLGARARRMSHNLGVVTVPGFLAERFGSQGLRILAAIVVFIFLIPYSASVYKGLGEMFRLVFGLEYEYAVIGMAVVTAFYLVLGGYFAVSLIDFILGMVMLVGSTLMIGVLVMKVAGMPAGQMYMIGGENVSMKVGLGGVFDAIQNAYEAHMPVGRRPGWLLLGGLVFMTSFGTWGLPQMSQKFFAVKDEGMFVKGGIATCLFAGVIGGVAYFMGSMLHMFFEKPLAVTKVVDGVEKTIPKWDAMVPQLLQNELPEWLLAVILLLMFSASMSTLAALVMTSASAVSVDIVGAMKKCEKKGGLGLMRVMSAVFVAISCVIALNDFTYIVQLISYSWGTTAGAFMGVMLYAFFWKGTTKWGAYAGMVSGLLCAGVVFNLPMICGWFGYEYGGLGLPVGASVAMIVPLFVVPVVSWVTPGVEEARIAKAFTPRNRGEEVEKEKAMSVG
ncbi:Sodium/proline symporter [Poriferisphaera corsica]|uniref:Sodium/proline symporter n=1 Tax=Poriferisphaera corsica TaxID=2528020 RepID=A0A517YPB2_9BACT|nr:sodium:solute symporter family protein [Poriferisphaera corsica]QDU32075.1 Sodium/proline symporter [Poriferisphaera corsica]